MARTFDEAELLDRVDQDIEFLAETVEMLVSDGSSLLEQVRQGVASNDGSAIGRHAHALKGMISNFCAAEAQACALTMEQIGKSGDLASAATALASLESALRDLTAELLEFVKAKQ